MENTLIEEQIIVDAKGQPEYVILPVARYRKIIRLLEDHGLAQAILEAENSPRLSKAEALALLEDDER